MSLQLQALRSLLWSELCTSNVQAYSQYLSSCESAIQYGCSTVQPGLVAGTGPGEICYGGGIDFDGGAVSESDGGRSDTSAEVVGGTGVASSVVDGEDNGHCGVGHKKDEYGSGRVAVGDAGGCGSGLCNSGGCDHSSDRGRWRPRVDAEVDGGSVRASTVLDANQPVRGRHWATNRYKREKRKREKKNRAHLTGQWRRTDCSGGCISDDSACDVSAVTVKTVDTRTAVEIEAMQTLAARRVMENKVAEKVAEHRLTALQDATRSDAVARLAAAKLEQRINSAKASSQKSFKECDESMASLGSVGSAGEFALKQELKKYKDRELIYEYTKKQAEYFAKHASPEVLGVVAAMKPPVLLSNHEVFGDCPAEYTEEQRESYDMGLSMDDIELERLCGTLF